ncbi:peroxiredoxin [Carboxydothermus islandicus]|uniref:Peroxiredoxin n=2 Tax=Carboxydothermus islandicus TaxID=661089 RepID=A0A1L8D0E8_9THEO|nr:peroxiredoxin [Carboxydothermus islandicus]
MLQIGDLAPEFSLPSTAGKNLSLKDFSGKIIVLYFYPKDNTSA